MFRYDFAVTSSIGEEPARPLAEQPTRPERQSHIRSPFEEGPPPAPASVVTSMWLWIASGLVPVLGLVYSLTRFTEVSEHLKEAARVADPAASADAIDKVANVTALIAMLALAVPVILQIVFALLMVNGRSWARFMLIFVGVLELPAAAIAFGALSDEGEQTQNNLEIGIGIQAVLVLLAIVLMFLPGANLWYRERRR